MKKILYWVIFLLFIVGSFLFGSWYGHRESPKTKRPGDVPLSSADRAQQDSEEVPSSFPPGTVRISPQRQQIIGVRIGQVTKTSPTFILRTLGRVAVDETRIYRLNAAVDGWIQETYNNSTGSLVKKEETLATFYSPDFLAAEQAYIFALNSLDRFQAGGKETPDQIQLTKLNVQQYINSLRNLGMGEYQIKTLARTRQHTENIFITAPVTGFILARNVSPGQRFEKGTEWYRLADLSRVWILADLFENEIQWVKPGAKVRVTLPYRKKTFQAIASTVLPQFDPASRTLKVRLEMENPEFVLRPDMFVDVELPVQMPPTVTIPLDAILDSGLKRTVFVDRGQGLFEPREVETGWRLGDWVEIIKGLETGERIVVSGNFLIDSESKMELAAAGMYSTLSQDPVCGLEVSIKKAEKAGWKTTYGGNTYYFSSDDCQREFERDPERFVKKEDKESPAGQTTSPKAYKKQEPPA
jgi:membrane fusion protein, copper/silver efflux system